MIYWIAAIVYGLDQWIKWLVRTHMALHQAIPVLPPVLYLDYIRNPGGAFGILPHAQWLFLLVALLVIGAVIYVDHRYHPGRWTKVALGLVVAGALGNLTDRVVAGSVTDYVYVQIINFPIFNLADAAIDVGILWLILHSFASPRSEGVKAMKSKEVDE